MAEVIPAILEKDLKEVEKKIRLVEGLVHWVQIDIADGILVPNTVMPNPSDFKELETPLKMELHMMVKDPLKTFKEYSETPFKRYIAHVEADNVEGFIEEALKYDIEIGLAIDGPTAVEKLKPYMEDIDFILVMAIKAGFSGQPYKEDTADKIKKILDMEFDISVAVDGAMDDINAAKVVAAGARRINSNSYLFKAPDIKKAILTLEVLGETRPHFT